MVTFYVLKVPFNFPCPPNEPWVGFAPSISDLRRYPELVAKIPELFEFDPDEDYCLQCLSKYKRCNGQERVRYCIYRNPENVAVWKRPPPKGDGFQVWTKYTAGPISPVLPSFGEVCEWMEKNASQHTRRKATKDEWAKLLVLEDSMGERQIS